MITRITKFTKKQAVISLQGMAEFKLYMNIVWLYLYKSFITFMSFSFSFSFNRLFNLELLEAHGLTSK